MNDFLYNYYIEDRKKDLDLTILCILHELRVATAKQIHQFMYLNNPISDKTIQKHLLYLVESKLIQSFQSLKDSRIKIYYLDRLGYQSIQGYYPLVKVPEYNWYHCLMINDCLIQTLRLVKEQPHLRYIQTERRQVYEIKDMEKKKYGRIFFVSDFLLRFQSKELKNINWYFEIELTIKTKKRYKTSVFVRYINYLNRHPDARLIYVTPSHAIHEELAKYKMEIERTVKDKAVAETIFSRFHIFPMNQFEMELNRLLETDAYINW